MSLYHRRRVAAVRQALDEARFGTERTLNLRVSLPKPPDAVARAEAWLRQQQVDRGGEVLIITGRGAGSPGGVSVVREAIVKLLGSLKRRGVVADHREHTPGSFVVTVAPMSALLAAPARRREPRIAAPLPPSLAALDPETRSLLEQLARRSIESLGVRHAEPHLEAEMLRQFGAIAQGIPESADREDRLRRAVRKTLDELDDAP